MSSSLRRVPPSESPYPHDTHPGLVPGVSVEEQRVRYRTDKITFGVAGALIVGFVVWGAVSTESLTTVSKGALDAVVTYGGWVFTLLAAVMLLFLLFVGFSRYGRIPLGKDGEEPAYSMGSWIAMLFAAGMGVGLIFFGVYEPVTYYMTPPPGRAAAESYHAMHSALAQTIFHWGLQAWAIYALVGAAVGYAGYRRGRPLLMSAIFGQRAHLSVGGRLIDMFAIVGILFATSASLGLGTLQIGRGLQIITGLGEVGNAVLIAIIAVLTCVFLISAVSGVAKGIRRLSNFNMVLAAVVAFFLFVAGPTVFLLNFIPSVVGTYFGEMFQMLSLSASWGTEAEEFMRSWTLFYWAWWVSWAPFVGVFVARISRGRTLRQYVSVVLLAPTVICVLAFSVFGGTAIWLQRDGVDIAGAASPEDMLFRVLDALPFAQIMPIAIIVLLAVFFITSADSATLVMASMSQQGKPEPDRKIIIFWGVALAGVSSVMLAVGGANALQGLQDLVTVAALPFAVILLALIPAFLRDLSTDPMSLRHHYARTALDNAVRQGMDEHGDDFALEVRHQEGPAAAGHDVDSTGERMSSWYQRTDENDQPVEYDYRQDTYVDARPAVADQPAAGERPTVDERSPRNGRPPEQH
ncbi:BCCT family transporter [Kocuria sp. KD4]|uniref:BCCT family transporter n=1 Tax=Kocuria sp. KD4 TaxID=2719588 RepID=UPI00142793E8|nr:BCCT family transporter [Kocuria sp. KD4]QIR69033.1 BCCT family transporter [Kocuria sp. KD4]